MSSNRDTLEDFTLYCLANPTERFWQALRNWSGRNFVFVSDSKPPVPGLDDTFYFEGRGVPVGGPGKP